MDNEEPRTFFLTPSDPAIQSPMTCPLCLPLQALLCLTFLASG